MIIVFCQELLIRYSPTEFNLYFLQLQRTPVFHTLLRVVLVIGRIGAKGYGPDAFGINDFDDEILL